MRLIQKECSRAFKGVGFAEQVRMRFVARRVPNRSNTERRPTTKNIVRYLLGSESLEDHFYKSLIAPFSTYLCNRDLNVLHKRSLLQTVIARVEGNNCSSKIAHSS